MNFFINYKLHNFTYLKKIGKVLKIKIHLYLIDIDVRYTENAVELEMNNIYRLLSNAMTNCLTSRLIG